jgi:CheY-like chemotaxis protein
MDDETYVRDVIGELLESLGHEVVTVAGADEAIEVFRREHESGRSFDTVMLDLTIPGGMGGRGVLARMKEIDPQVRAVASSGYSGDPVMADPTRHGFVAQLHKPYTVEDLRAVLARVCSRPGRGPHVR